MKHSAARLIICLLGFVIPGCAGEDQAGGDQIAEIRAIACGQTGKPASPWHLANLYDCATDSLYIPYQLWTGAEWDGDKNAPCMHIAGLTFWVNGSSETRIEGPVPRRGLETWSRTKTDGSKIQHFTCHAAGIGRVHDSRHPGRTYRPGRCKFPAGFAWTVGKRRMCEQTAIRITRLEIDPEDTLTALRFDWWYQAGGRLVHDHSYRYEVGIGMTTANQQ